MGDWGPNEWNALAQMLLAAAVICGGLWGLYTYAQGQRSWRGQWLNSIFADFYCKYSFASVRAKFEHDYDGSLRPLIQQRVTNRDIPIDEAQTALLLELDALLNYFENILSLEENGLLRRRERLALFEYWFGLLRADDHGELRRYINRSGWDRVTELIGRDTTNYLLLAEADGAQEIDPAVAGKLRFVQDDSVRSLGRGVGPARQERRGTMSGRLYEILDLSVLAALNSSHGIDPRRLAGSGCVRRCVRTRDRRIDAWCYQG